MVKIIISIEDAGNNQVTLDFEKVGEMKSYAVMRTFARISRSLGAEFSNIHRESEYIKELLCESEER